MVGPLPLVQPAPVETILQSMLDPVTRKLSVAPDDDEHFTEDDHSAVAEAEEW